MSGEYGVSMFCDDIRDEIGGKRTLVGVYNSQMIIQDPFPAVVPTFGILVSLLEPVTSSEWGGSLKVYLPSPEGERVVIEIDLPPERNQALPANISDPAAKYLTTILALKISPLLIEAEGFIRVRAYKKEREIRLGSLQVVQQGGPEIKE